MKPSVVAPLALLTLLASTSAWSAETLSLNSLHQQAQIDRFGEGVTFGADSAWIAEYTNVARVNAADNSVVDIKLEGVIGPFRRPAFGENALWLAALQTGTLLKVDPVSNRVTLKIDAPILDATGSIGVGSGSVWAITGGGAVTLSRYSAYTGAQQGAIALPRAGSGVLAAFDSVWVTSPLAGAVYKVDPATDTVATIPVGKRPRYLTADENSVWVLNQGDGSVTRIDGATGEVVATVDAGLRGLGGDIAAGGGSVWATLDTIRIAQIDPASNTLIRTYTSLAGPGPEPTAAIAYGAGSIWLSGAGLQRFEEPKLGDM